MKFHLTKIEIKWGLLFSLMTLAWMSLEKMLGWHDVHIDQHATLTNLFSIPAIAIYVLAFLEKRKAAGGIITWKQLFTCGMGITLLAGLLAPLVQVITFYIISPDYFQNAIEYAVTHEGKDRTEMEGFFNLKSYLWQSVVGAWVMGLVTAALVALALKKEN